MKKPIILSLFLIFCLFANTTQTMENNTPTIQKKDIFTYAKENNLGSMRDFVGTWGKNYINQLDNNDNMPIHYACSSDKISASVLKYLVETGEATLDDPNENGDLPIHIACKNPALGFMPTKRIQLIIFYTMFSDSQYFLDKVDNNGNTPLHLILNNRSLPPDKLESTVHYFFSKLKEQIEKTVNEKNANGNTLLHLACANPNTTPKIITTLLQHGTKKSITEKNSNNETPIDVIAKQIEKHVKLMPALLDIKKAIIAYYKKRIIETTPTVFDQDNNPDNKELESYHAKTGILGKTPTHRAIDVIWPLLQKHNKNMEKLTQDEIKRKILCAAIEDETLCSILEIIEKKFIQEIKDFKPKHLEETIQIALQSQKTNHYLEYITSFIKNQMYKNMKLLTLLTKQIDPSDFKLTIKHKNAKTDLLMYLVSKGATITKEITDTTTNSQNKAYLLLHLQWKSKTKEALSKIIQNYPTLIGHLIKEDIFNIAHKGKQFNYKETFSSHMLEFIKSNTLEQKTMLEVNATIANMIGVKPHKITLQDLSLHEFLKLIAIGVAQNPQTIYCSYLEKITLNKAFNLLLSPEFGEKKKKERTITGGKRKREHNSPTETLKPLEKSYTSKQPAKKKQKKKK